MVLFMHVALSCAYELIINIFITLGPDLLYAVNVKTSSHFFPMIGLVSSEIKTITLRHYERGVHILYSGH